MRSSAVLTCLGLLGLSTVTALGCRSASSSSPSAETAGFDKESASRAASTAAPEPTPMASAAPAGKPMSAPAAAAPKADERGEGVGLGGIGTLGHGAGGGGFGDGVGRLGGAHRSASGVAAPAREFGMFAIQGPSIAAGEWDDNANYHEFQRYLANEERLPLHRVDVTDRRFLVVRDMNGKPVPRCQVTIRDVDRHQTTLTTLASGRAILFPHAEGMTSADLEATTSCPGAIAVHRSFNVTDQDGVVDFRLASAREIPAVRPVDVAFILDTTGSMGEEIDAVRSTIAKVASRLGRENFRVRLALVEYKDRGDVFVTKVHPFSTSTDRFLADISRVTASGGGDLPESVNEGLHVGLTGLEWAQDSVARFAFLIGDAPPHLDYPNDADYAVEMRRAAHQGVQLFTVAASGMDALGQAVFRQVAEYTGGTNLFVLRGGAGPQSTGAGDPKSSCGGTQTNYSSGNLDTLIVSKVTRELHGLDGDPMRIAGLYRDEDAKPCNERVAYND